MTAVLGSINDGFWVSTISGQANQPLTQLIFFCPNEGCSAPDLDIAAFKLGKTNAVVSFSKPVNLHKCSLSLDSNTKFDTKKWLPINSSISKYDTIWTLKDVFELNSDSSETLELEFIDENGQSHTLPIVKHENSLFGIKMPKFGYEFGASVLDVLKEQLSSCQQLLEFEPNSKCK